MWEQKCWHFIDFTMYNIGAIIYISLNLDFDINLCQKTRNNKEMIQHGINNIRRQKHSSDDGSGRKELPESSHQLPFHYRYICWHIYTPKSLHEIWIQTTCIATDGLRTNIASLNNLGCNFDNMKFYLTSGSGKEAVGRHQNHQKTTWRATMESCGRAHVSVCWLG